MSHRGVRTGWQTCSCGTAALKWLSVTWKVLARPKLILSSLQYQTDCVIARTSFLPSLLPSWKKQKKIHVKCEKSSLYRQNNQAYFMQRNHLCLYMQFNASINFERFLRKLQNLICTRNSSVEEEIYLLGPLFLLHLDWNGYKELSKLKRKW